MRSKIAKLLEGSFLYYFLRSLYFTFNQIGSRKKFRRLSRSATQIKLNLGSGPVCGENGWTTIDQYDCDICWDLRKGIPLKDNTVESIYSSHLLEHLDYKSNIKFINECKRVLIPGGKMLVCVPDARKYISAYVSDTEFRPKNSLYADAIVDTSSAMDQLNYIAYLNGEHKYMFDQENLINIFLKCGFSDVRRRDFNDEIDRIERDFQSIYCLAVK